MKPFTKIYRMRKVAFFLLFYFMSFKTYAQNERLIGNNGLQGEELVSIAIHPTDKNVIFIGTNKSLYKRNLAAKGPWESFRGLSAGGCRVNQILITDSSNWGFIATEKGLYDFQLDSMACQNIFNRSDESERSCLSVCVLEDGSIFVGTKGGLFFKKRKGDWSKINSPFDNEEIVYLYGTDKVVYVAVQSGVYKSDNHGENWQKIFNAYLYRDVSENNEADPNSEKAEEEGSSPVIYTTGLAGNPSTLYVLTTYGIFSTEDAGKSWNRLPSAGVDLADLRFLSVTLPAKRIFAVIKTGIYELKNESWKPFAYAYDCRQVAQRASRLILITSRDIFEYPLTSAAVSNFPSTLDDPWLDSFANEPSVKEVQQMAIEYSETSDQKIKDWRRRASIKAVLPEVSLDFDRTVATAMGATYERVLIGPTDWGVSLKWDLSALIYNPDQTSIDTRSKLMVQLRNDILAEVTRVYFERRKLQIELFSKKTFSQEEELEKKLRLMELTALLDRLTGSYFSSHIK